MVTNWYFWFIIFLNPIYIETASFELTSDIILSFLPEIRRPVSSSRQERVATLVKAVSLVRSIRPSPVPPWFPGGVSRRFDSVRGPLPREPRRCTGDHRWLRRRGKEKKKLVYFVELSIRKFRKPFRRRCSQNYWNYLAIHSANRAVCSRSTLNWKSRSSVAGLAYRSSIIRRVGAAGCLIHLQKLLSSCHPIIHARWIDARSATLFSAGARRVLPLLFFFPSTRQINSSGEYFERIVRTRSIRRATFFLTLLTVRRQVGKTA